jgi:hypothetical protein
MTKPRKIRDSRPPEKLEPMPRLFKAPTFLEPSDAGPNSYYNVCHVQETSQETQTSAQKGDEKDVISSGPTAPRSIPQPKHTHKESRSRAPCSFKAPQNPRPAPYEKFEAHQIKFRQSRQIGAKIRGPDTEAN